MELTRELKLKELEVDDLQRSRTVIDGFCLTSVRSAVSSFYDSFEQLAPLYRPTKLCWLKNQQKYKS